MSGVELVGLILAVPTVVQLFFGTAEKIHEKMKNDRRMKDQAQDFRRLVVDDSRAQLNRDFELARGILKDQTTGKEEKERISRLFSATLDQLQHINDLADVVQSSDRLEFRKRSAALRDMKDRVINIRVAMSEFHQLVMSLHTIAISESTLLLEDQDFILIGPGNDHEVLNDTAVLARGRASQFLLPDNKAHEYFLLESKPYATRNMRSVKKDLRILSQRLAAAERQNGILPLLGFRNNTLRNEFQLVFAMPSSMGSPQTLGSLYGSVKTRPPLNTRIHICGQLAEAVLQTHMLGLVHKNIQPGNVLLFAFPHETDENESFPASYLCGWHYARSSDAGITRLVGESLWQRAIYQHPERQSEHVEDEYCMGHDIYSLGVCMLEILLWDPLVTTGERDLQERLISRSYRTIFDQYEQSQGIREETADMERLVRDPNAVQRTLVRMNKALVPAAAGIKMRDVVSQCLTCLDGEDILGCFKVSQEREDKDVAVGFVDTVLKDIRRIMSAI